MRAMTSRSSVLDTLPTRVPPEKGRADLTIGSAPPHVGAASVRYADAVTFDRLTGG
jgi:hypothetical protein